MTTRASRVCHFLGDRLQRFEIFLLACPTRSGQRIYHTAGLGSMGYGLPTSLAVCIGGGNKRTVLVDGVKQCELAQDYVSREILAEILVDTEEHIDFLETQLALLGSLGEQNYLQSAMGQLEG